MRPQNFLKKYCLSVVAFGAMTGALAFSPSIAQAAVSMPLNNWEVSSVDGAGKSFSNYCVAANAFDNRTIMIIAYEKGQKSSIAFNLQEKKFKPKEKYSVTLQFSNGTTGQFMASAENESTLIIQVGTDRSLWQNLVQSTTVSLSTSDVRKEYSLKQFDFVYSSLNECVGETLRAEDLKNNAVVSTTPTSQAQNKEQHSSVSKGSATSFERAAPTPTPIPVPVPVSTNDPAVQYINSLLKQSSITVVSSDKAPVRQDDYLRYAWTTEQDLKGKFEQVYWPTDKSFHDLIQNYFERNDMTCNSDFLPMTNEPYRVGDIAIADGQAFCMRTEDSIAIAYLFFGIGNTFTVIEHKGRFDQLETALSVRENLRQTIEYIATGGQSDISTLPTTLPVAHNAATDTTKSRAINTTLPMELNSQ